LGGAAVCVRGIGDDARAPSDPVVAVRIKSSVYRFG
jgi:hypothetical protein